ncbi:MAG: TetR/AcrR family transcriptional regulator [Myxococcales bacterium FL481]|nr:MAG: TetR/AcrR family transcriptional regulator [Myxococcales bacterium FL481]
MAFRIQLHLDPALYVRDPEETELGRRIVDAAIQQLVATGFEKLTFRRLAESIGSTEASVYRYFENKHRLLLYLVSWYWSWVDYRLEYRVNAAELPPRERLHRVIDVLLTSTTYDPTWSHIDEAALHRIVVVESNKAYQTRWVDDDNAEGLFAAYKALAAKVADLILEADPDYAHPRALASTLIEASHQQIFFAEHLPSLSDGKVTNGDFANVREFLTDLVDRALQLGD